jgi:protein phosphatase
MEIISSYATDIGRKRKMNEDSVLANDWLQLYIVADGMGGHSCGDVASQTAIEVINGRVEMAKKKERLEKKPKETLVDAVCLANTALWELSREMPGCDSMGTTVAGVIVLGETLYVAHVGDSRVYRIRDEGIEQITTDHSLVEEQIALGQITREDAKTSPVRNVITRAMGLKEDVEVETSEHKLQDGDFILICSDGLNGMIDDELMLEIVLRKGRENLNSAMIELIEAANLNGGTDNITVVLLDFRF